MLRATDPNVRHAGIVATAPGGRLPGLTDTRHARRLRIAAAAVARLLASPRGVPARLADPALAEEIDRVRRQLLPIGSLAMLAESWSREHVAATVADRRVARPVRLAYAVRWLELSGAIDERPWRMLVGGSST